MSEEHERELLTRAIAGDEAAIQQLLLDQHDYVAAAIRRKIPPNLQGVLSADDVCQEAYVAAVRELGSFKPHRPGAFRGWLLTVAEHKLVDMIRGLQAAKRGGGKSPLDLPVGEDTSSVVALLEQVAVHQRTPSRSVAGHELVRAVHDALADLKEDYRMALRCRYLEGMSVSETARQMERSEGAILKLCNRGLRQLSELIGSRTRFFLRGDEH